MRSSKKNGEFTVYMLIHFLGDPLLVPLSGSRQTECFLISHHRLSMTVIILTDDDTLENFGKIISLHGRGNPPLKYN